VTCGQTGPQSAVLRSTGGGHHGTLMLTSDEVGTAQFPSPKTVSVKYEPDGAGGVEYDASAAVRTGTGSLTFKPDGSGSVDLVVPYNTGSPGNFHGTSVHIVGSWTC